MTWRALISGEAQGPVAKVTRAMLCLPAGGYRTAVQCRNALYDRSLLKSQPLPVPVICVGNITAGGTGKTPMVVWVCQVLQQLGAHPAILTRGYRQSETGDNDEVRLLRRQIPDVPIIVDADRVRGGHAAIEQEKADVLVMDDGFQHRRLRRDLDIVLIDATCPFGYGRLLPAGLLREPLSSLQRAHAVVLTRSGQIGSARRAEVEKQLQRWRRVDVVMATGDHEPIAWRDRVGERRDTAALAGRRVWAVCGLGNPQAFVRTLENLGAVVAGATFWPDHHHYTQQDCHAVAAQAEKAQAQWLVTTEKDWVKLETQSSWLTAGRWSWLQIQMRMTSGETALRRQLERIWKMRPRPCGTEHLEH